MKFIASLVVLFTFLLAAPASALIMTGKGNEPIRDPGWPVGADRVANLKSRIGWYEGPPFGGGQWVLQYRGDVAALNEAITALAHIRAASVEIVLHDGPANSQFLRDDKDPKADTSYDWSFTVWIPMNWHRLYNDPRSTFLAEAEHFRKPVDAPRIDVYVTKRIDWAKVVVPKEIKLIDERTAEADKTAKGSTIKAEVFDTATGRPVVQPVLLANKRNAQGKSEPGVTATGDADGRVWLKDIPAGPGTLVLTAAGYAPRIISYEDFKDGQTRKMSLELCKLASLKGIVKDGSGKPLAGVKLHASGVMGIDGRGYRLEGSPTATTDEKGVFELAGLPLGYTSVIANAKGFHQTNHMRDVLASPTADLVITMNGTGTIKGTVKDAQRGSASNVNVEPVGGSKRGSWGGSTKISPDGTFVFENVPPGEYVLSTKPLIPGEPRASDVIQVKVEPGKTAEVTLTPPVK